MWFPLFDTHIQKCEGGDYGFLYPGLDRSTLYSNRITEGSWDQRVIWLLPGLLILLNSIECKIKPHYSVFVNKNRFFFQSVSLPKINRTTSEKICMHTYAHTRAHTLLLLYNLSNLYVEAGADRLRLWSSEASVSLHFLLWPLVWIPGHRQTFACKLYLWMSFMSTPPYLEFLLCGKCTFIISQFYEEMKNWSSKLSSIGAWVCESAEASAL